MKILVLLCSLQCIFCESRTDDDLSYSELKADIRTLENEIRSLRETVQTLRRKCDDKTTQETRYLVGGALDFEQEILKLIKEVDAIKENLGSTYTRWGRTQCPGNSTVVYKGYTAGKWFEDTGGPANYVCLPEDPQWAKYLDGLQNIGNRIYGTEYEDNYESTFNPFDVHMDDEDAPCVVCRTNRATTLMIPARTSCYNGWNLEYTGYLMTMSRGHPSASEYICVDREPEALMHGSNNDDGNMMYIVEATCGSLPCLPYVNGRELACAVCSK